MENVKGSEKQWSNTQAYGFAIVSLLLGMASGYFVHAPSKPAEMKPDPHAQVEQHSAATMANMAQPTEEQMQHMATKKAEPLLAKLASNPNDAETLVEVGKNYLYARQFQTAAEYYEKSVKIKADPKVLTTLGGVYHYGGDDDKALDAWTRALQIDPGYADALVNMGLVKLQAKSDPEGAIAAWQKMLKANPNHPQRAKVQDMIARAQKQIKTSAAK